MTDSHSSPLDKIRIVPCPRCGGDSIYASSNRFRPFCSERCKMADLGAWATENYRLPAQPRTGDLADDDAGDVPPTSDVQDF